MAYYSHHNFQSLSVNRRAASRSQKEAPSWALAARHDLEVFRQYVCGHETWGHHKEWANILTTGKDAKFLPLVAGPDTLILAPRGSSKSTFLLEWIAWVLGQVTAPDIKWAIKILLICFNQNIANSKSEQLQSIVDSDKYRIVFPWVKPNKGRWSLQKWDIDRKAAGLTTTDEPYTLATAGLAGAVTSRRAHLMVFDDLIKRPKDIENPAIRETMRNNYHNVILPTIMDGGRTVCLGTRMRLDDIYTTTFTPKNNWHVVEEQAILVDANGRERSYCEELSSLEFLRDRRDKDPDAFLLQFQNKIPASMDARFKSAWMVDATIPRRFDEVCVACDLSAGLKETADYTVMMLVGRKGDNYYIIDMARGRWSGNVEKMDVLLGLLIENGMCLTDLDYEIDTTGKPVWSEDPKRGRFWIPPGGYYINLYADSNSYQLSFQGDCEATLMRLGLHWITPWPMKTKSGGGGRDKLMKYRAMTGIFQRLKVVYNKYKDLQRVKYELENAGMTDHDDCADALYFAMDGMGALTGYQYDPD